jgi:hypothetical protein
MQQTVLVDQRIAPARLAGFVLPKIEPESEERRDPYFYAYAVIESSLNAAALRNNGFGHLPQPAAEDECRPQATSRYRCRSTRKDARGGRVKSSPG